MVALVRTLENLGWVRSQLHDHGDYTAHCKYFPGANLTAFVGEWDEVFVDLSVQIGSGKEKLDSCCFLVGRHLDLYDYPTNSWQRQHKAYEILPLAQVDPIALSEVLKDLYTIAAKGEQ